MEDDKKEPHSRRGDFYGNGPHFGGQGSSDRRADDPEPFARDEDEEPVERVTSLPGGAKRDSYFKRRDY